jgi:hypothetical protein
MEVAAELQKINISFHQNRFVSPLIRGDLLSYAVVRPGVGNIKMPHELGEVGFRGLYEHMKMIAHQNIGVKRHAIDF